MDAKVDLYYQVNVARTGAMVTLTETLTPSEAARRAGVSESVVRGWLRDGTVTCTVTPLGRLVDPRSLEAFLATGKQGRLAREGGT